MKVLMLTLTAPFMMMFLLAGIQTIEWCLDRGTPVPWQAYGILVVVAIWCILAANVQRGDWEKLNRAFSKKSKNK